jgi:hypothetical protein
MVCRKPGSAPALISVCSVYAESWYNVVQSSKKILLATIILTASGNPLMAITKKWYFHRGPDTPVILGLQLQCIVLTVAYSILSESIYSQWNVE